ncbi:MAG: hypothetical protein WA826_12695, partial [Silvibacterium sp.]
MLISPPAPAREGFGLSRTERPGLHDGGEGAEVGLNGLENRGDDRGCLGIFDGQTGFDERGKCAGSG